MGMIIKKWLQMYSIMGGGKEPTPNM